MASNFFSQVEAKRDFIRLCRLVATDHEKVYVKDKSGTVFLTLAPTPARCAKPILEVSVQSFRENFSRYCSLVKTGYAFRVSSKRGAEVFARRHTSYVDPLEHVMAAWRRSIFEMVRVNIDEAVARVGQGTVNQREMRELLYVGLSSVSDQFLGGGNALMPDDVDHVE